MSLEPGTRLGPYVIEGSLGAGGMGVVYRARDTRLDRTVAIKVLPPDLADDPLFRERFEREARVISSLSHPHICPLFDVGREAGVEFLVMEHLEGETLSARLERDLLPFGQALTIAIEIAAALDTAHRAGVIHRDLKPGNIFLTKNGAKLLDFGLAKSAGRAVASSAVRPSAGMPTALPTTPPVPSITAQGTILGTFQYMAPEQLEGAEVDSRTDIFAFGCVLYEMVTGRKAFQGRTQVSLIGAILKDDPPPVSTVQAMSPAAFDFVVRKCLSKDPDRRWQTASDLLSQLEWIAQGGGSVALPAGVARVTVPRGIHPILAMGAAIVLAVAAGVAVWFLKPVPAAARAPMTRFSITVPSDQTFTRGGRHLVTISPDGTKLVYVANQQLYLRAIEQLEAVPIRGTNIDPVNPFFSPDGQWVAFWASNQLKKIAIAGGAAVKLCDAMNPFGASWTGDRILFGQGTAGIMEVSADGGTPKVIAKVDTASGELAHGPQLLPGGDAVLFTIARGQQWEDARVVVHSLKTGVRKVLLEGATDARYVETGHLVYGHDTTILGLPFDAQQLVVKGGPVALLEGVTQAVPTGSMQFDLSLTGTAAFVPGTIAQSRTLVWADRHGKEETIPAGARPFANPRISPDGTRVAVEIVDQEQAIWIWELMRGTLTRLTFGRASDAQPRWSPDGLRVLYSSVIDGQRGVIWKSADGTGAATQLTRGSNAAGPRSITPDGKLLVANGGTPTTQSDLNVIAMDGQHEVRPLLNSPANENWGELSPDGRWLAYQSDESGMWEIYVRPFPDVDKGGRWQVSNGGGTSPRWSRNGDELFYISPGTGRSLMVAGVRTAGATFVVSKPISLFNIPNYAPAGYDVARDGRFLNVRFGETNSRQEIVVVQNWIEELKARVAAK